MPNELEMNKRILENLLLRIVEAEGDETEDASSENDALKTPFEKDPMGFILSKYHTLDALLSELMTPSYREYLNAIFVVAPKPTTFKILLHNGQVFFLTYLGKAYQATVEGKDYYLMTIGEKERCMLAISRLLRYGSPLKTKGPEGAEQGTREEGGETGGTETEETPTTPETGAETGEELKESINILTRLLIEATKVKKGEELFSLLQSLLSSEGYKIKRDTDKGLHMRTTIGTQSEVESVVDAALSSFGISNKDYSIESISAGDYDNGAKSGQFTTYKITLKKDKEGIPKGSQVYLVSTTKEGKSTIAQKSLTPSVLGLDGKTYKNADAIIKAVNSATSKLDKNLAETLNLLMIDVKNASKPEFDQVKDISGYSENVPFDKKTQQKIQTILPGDLSSIGKDFGEILGAILMSNKIKINNEVEFPGGNEPLIDFYIGGYGISSKYKTGAAATLTKLISTIKPKQLKTPEEKNLYNNFSKAFELGVADSYLELAKKMDIPALNVLAKILGISKKNITLQFINDKIIQVLEKEVRGNNDPNADKKIKSAFGPFFAEAGSQPSYPIKWGATKSNKYYGLITSPLAFAVAKKLNSDPKNIQALKGMINKVEVKQLYLDFNLKSNSMSFKLKSLADPNANFSFTPANMSVYNPDNGKMAFKMK